MAVPVLPARETGVEALPAAGPGQLPDAVDVLVAGAGPVGSALALDLAHRGVSALVLERRDSIGTANVRARNISVRTMELARRWGIADRFRVVQTLPGAWQRGIIICTRVSGPELAPAVYRDEPIWTPHVPWHQLSAEPPQDLPQYHVNRILRERALELGARVVTGWEVTAVEQTAHEAVVTAEHLATGELKTVRARYVVGCDGGRSAVRRSAGIAMLTESAHGRMLNVSFRFPHAFDRLGVRPGINFMVFNQEVHGLAHPYEPDWWRIGMGPIPLAEDLSALDLRHEIARYLGIDAEAAGISDISYTEHLVQKRVAETYRRGRVLLAGDAAVAFPPHLGQSLNTGVADAVTLSWMLAGILAGWAGEDVLDGYAAERAETSHRLADASMAASDGTTELFKLLAEADHLEEDSAEGAAERAEIGARAAALLGCGADGLIFEHRHHASPVVVPDEEDAPPFDPARYQPWARAGHQAPHVWLADGDPLVDHLGRWFTLLDTGADENDVTVIAAAAARAGVPLTVLRAANARVREVYDRPLVLVRPDLLIAWTGSHAQPDPASLFAVVTASAAA